jgi:membrane protein implicated in regulation of membrane protease activity
VVIWVAIWTLAGIAGALMVGIVALLIFWSYEAGVWWLVLPFVGFMIGLAVLAARRKRPQEEEEEDAPHEGLGQTDMSSFELELRR